MPDDILVVEYEPRYTERVKQALSGHSLNPVFARDGEEALRALERADPKLIVLSSIIPKIGTSELIKHIRNRATQPPPILVTISGYNGKSPRADAVRLGASDILPKPYSESEFLGKVQQMLGIQLKPTEAAASWTSEVSRDLSAAPVAAAATSAAPPPERRPAAASVKELTDPGIVTPTGTLKKVRRPNEDVDKMLADTLSGVRLSSLKGKRPEQEKSSAEQREGQRREARAKDQANLDRLLEDTLSGLEARLKKTTQDRPVNRGDEAAATPRSNVQQQLAPSEASTPGPAKDESGPFELSVHEERSEHLETPEGTRFGQYLLTERIATGGMAEVWKARMRGVEGFQKIVAIKKILPHLSDNAEFVEMFVDEAKLAAQLNHSNIIHIYDLGKVANSYYIAMEFIDGHDLKSILARSVELDQPLPLELSLFVASKIAAALDYAHRKRDFNEQDMDLVHRDVSPQNVLISYEGDIKLCDFGIAKAASKASHTLAGALKGKLQYMSPEQAWGRKIDRRSDIFALGVVLFEMLTGRRLFAGDNELSVLEQVRQARVQPPSSLSDEVTPEVEAIVMRSLEREPESRYQTAGEMAKDLDGVIYNFWPTPTSADLAIYMHNLHSKEARAAETAISHEEAGPEDGDSVEISSLHSPEERVVIERVPLAATVATPRVAVVSSLTESARPMFTAEPARERRSIPLVAIIIGVLLLAGASTGAYFLFGDRSASEPPRPGVAGGGRTATRSATTATAPAAVTPSTSTSITTADPLAQVSSDDSRIDEEVRRRLEAERRRLEVERVQQLAVQNKKAARTEPTQAPKATPLISLQQPQPSPELEATPTQAPAVQPTPVPTPAAAAVQASVSPTARPVRQGDLVEPGTQGLVAPVLIKQYKPPYPPIAKLQRVEGIVVVSALISEDGKVLDARILRGVSQKVGINEAALEAVRRSSFRPATKDGVRVKSYKSVTIPFKL